MKATEIIGVIGGIFGVLGIGGFFGILKAYRKKIIAETRLKDKITSFHERLDRLKAELSTLKDGCVMGKQNTKDIEAVEKRVEKLEDESKENAERFAKIETGLSNISANVKMLVDNLVNKKKE